MAYALTVAEKGKDVVKRSIDSDKAVDALIDLIRQNGDWVEKGL